MTGNIVYEYMPGDQVWVIYQQCDDQASNSSQMVGSGVMEGKVIYYHAEVLQTQLIEYYGIQLVGTDSTRKFNVTDVFASIDDVMYEYERRLS